MLYNDFILAGITLGEIALIEKYAAINNLELTEYNSDLCLMNSNNEEILYKGLYEIVDFVKSDINAAINFLQVLATDELIQDKELLNELESKVNEYRQAA